MQFLPLAKLDMAQTTETSLKQIIDKIRPGAKALIDTKHPGKAIIVMEIE